MLKFSARQSHDIDFLGLEIDLKNRKLCINCCFYSLNLWDLKDWHLVALFGGWIFGFRCPWFEFQMFFQKRKTLQNISCLF